jgi:oligopeptide transport system ATP-binding protein
MRKIMALIEIASLTKRYGDTAALDGIDLTIHRGEVLGLVGESGSGKSTLAKLLVGLERPTGGSIRYDGRDIATLSRRERQQMRCKMQMIFQDPYASLNPRMTVEQIVGEGLEIHNLRPKAQRRDRIIELLDLVGLGPETLRRYPHEFSGGQRQRIGIARALAPEPEFLICDEPTSALDLSVQAQVVNLLQTLRKEMGLTYLFISHDLSVVRALADRIGVMYRGRIVEIGPARKIFGYPRHPYTKMLLSAIPLPDPVQEKERLAQRQEGFSLPEPITLTTLQEVGRDHFVAGAE